MADDSTSTTATVAAAAPESPNPHPPAKTTSVYKAICDIKFGDMNSDYLFSEDSLYQDSVDPRRSNPLYQIGRGIKSFFTRNLAPGSMSNSRPQVALVLRSQANSNPWVQNGVESLPQTYRHETARAGGSKVYYKYKVWISEYCGALECPNSVTHKDGIHQSRINMAIDAFPEPGSAGEVTPFPPGLLVHYGGDPSMGPVVLMNPTQQQIRLPGGTIDKTYTKLTQRNYANGANERPLQGPGDIEGFYNDLLTDYPAYRPELLAALAANAWLATSGFSYGLSAQHQAPFGRNSLVGGSFYCRFGNWHLDTCSSKGEGYKFYTWASQTQGLSTAQMRSSDKDGAGRYTFIMKHKAQKEYVVGKRMKEDAAFSAWTTMTSTGVQPNPETDPDQAVVDAGNLAESLARNFFKSAPRSADVDSMKKMVTGLIKGFGVYQ